MRRVMVGGILAGLFFVAVPAWSDQEPPARPDPGAVERAADWSTLASEFEAAVLRYIQLIEFTQRIEAEREQRAFDEALDRYARFEALTEQLTVQHEQEIEREFDDRVAQHVRKQAFTHELVEARKHGDYQQ